MEPDNLELLSDEALAQRARDGCGGALQLLLERMAPVAVRAAAGILGRRDEACDVAQETLLKIACEIGGYRAHGSVRGWVGVIAHRTALNRLKGDVMRRRREEWVGHDAVAPMDSVDPERVLEKHEMIEALRQELLELPALSVEVLSLYYLQEVPLADVAVQTGLSVDACKQRLARGREELGARLRRRGMSLACLVLLGWLCDSARAAASETTPACAAAWASAAVRQSRSQGLSRVSRMRTASTGTGAALISSIALFVVLALFMAGACSGRAQSTIPFPSGQPGELSKHREHREPGLTEIPRLSPAGTQTLHTHMENSEMNGYLRKVAASVALASGMLFSSRGTAAEGAVKADTVPVLSTPLFTFQTVETIQVPETSVRVPLEDVVDALKSTPEASLAKIPGNDLTAKAKYLLECASVSKSIVTTPVSDFKMNTDTHSGFGFNAVMYSGSGKSILFNAPAPAATGTGDKGNAAAPTSPEADTTIAAVLNPEKPEFSIQIHALDAGPTAPDSRRTAEFADAMSKALDDAFTLTPEQKAEMQAKAKAAAASGTLVDTPDKIDGKVYTFELNKAAAPAAAAPVTPASAEKNDF